MSDKVKPGKGIDDNKGVGFQTQGVDRAAMRKMYGDKDYGVKTGDEAS